MRTCLALAVNSLLAYLSIGASAALSQELQSIDHHPQLCSGYLGTIKDGSGEDWGSVTDKCPKNYAFYATLPSSSPRDSLPEDVSLVGFCCPLPAQDILTTNEFIEREQCPENSVATGLANVDCEDCRNALICTEINTQRYELSTVTPGVLWGNSSTFWKHRRRVQFGELPPGLKYGVSRRNKYTFVFAGCIGYPFGSLVVGKRNKRCQGILFRQLMYRGMFGDSPAGTPVKMYPDCNVVTSLFSTEPVCEG